MSASDSPRHPLSRLRAADLADVLATEVLDIEDGAVYLGIARNSLEYAAYRHRVAFVQYHAKKLFTKADLDDYARGRGRGRMSHLADQPSFIVGKPERTSSFRPRICIERPGS